MVKNKLSTKIEFSNDEKEDDGKSVDNQSAKDFSK